MTAAVRLYFEQIQQLFDKHCLEIWRIDLTKKYPWEKFYLYMFLQNENCKQ